MYNKLYKVLQGMNLIPKLMLWIVIRRCSCMTEVSLYFASTYCDEKPQTVTKNISYLLTWNGQISPKLCRFSFSSLQSQNQVCFESTIFDISSEFANIKILVKNSTGSPYLYGKYDTSVKKTCVKQAHKMTFSIEVPTGYVEPDPRVYLQLNITNPGNYVPDSEDLQQAAIIIVIGVSCFVFTICCSFVVVKKKKVSKLFRDLCNCFGKALCYCVKCKCADNDDNASFHCNCGDSFSPCGVCCSALANCCTSLILYVRGVETSNQTTIQQTELDYISGSSDNHILNSAVGSTEPPPSYQWVKDTLLSEDPTIPPPSYEEVTNRAPRISNDHR